MKTVMAIVGVAVVIVVIIIAVILVSLGSIIEKGVETAGSASLGTDVALSDADLSILGGRVSLAGLEIGNPTGFKTDHLFKFDKAQVAVTPTSLMQDEIVIDNIILEGPSLIVEQSGTGTNMSVVLENIKRTVPAKEEPAKEEAAEEEPKEEEPAAQKTFRIKLLRITGAEVTFASFMSAGKPITVPLPEIKMENISNSDGSGMQLAEVIEKVLVEMMQKALTEGKGIVPIDIMNDVRGDLGALAPELAGSVTDTAEELLEKTTETLKGLFQK
jgi:uncharacterized protein involved in outer membrane biogenesis